MRDLREMRKANDRELMLHARLRFIVRESSLYAHNARLQITMTKRVIPTRPCYAV